MSDRPKALVTAAVRGPGLDAPPRARRSHARLVARPAEPAHLQRRAARRADGGRGRVDRDRRERPVCGPTVRTRPGRGLQLPGRPQQRRRRGGHRGGRAGPPCAGSQRRRGRRADRRTPLRRDARHASPPTPTSGGARSTRTAPSPTNGSAPGSSPGRTAGLVGLGAVGRAARWRLRGLGMEVVAYDPYADEPTVSLEELLERADVVSMHAPVTDGDEGDDRRDAVRGHARRRRLPQQRAGRAPRHRRAGRRRSGPARCRQPGSTTSRASSSRPTTRSPASTRSC